MFIDPVVAVGVIRRLDAGWELYERDGRFAWYSETKPGFDDDEPTGAEVALILAARFAPPG